MTTRSDFIFYADRLVSFFISKWGKVVRFVCRWCHWYTKYNSRGGSRTLKGCRLFWKGGDMILAKFRQNIACRCKHFGLGRPPPITSTKEQYNALLRPITRRDHKNRLDLDQNGVKTGIKLLWVIS